ncbi:hypothetical protein G7Z17_g1176 [Cylindrodendrum hubeiense]|uniref:Heterokaryon incompatibility domain-containing protein n=1 Tax=Cylindrodendrum hubeiense TaxID=595255 RepID=A0A9P5HNE8_9HYPO|nr:hypothetical protein G7Z17_g1176 [Cylindrodendrum hubeiense]
MFTKPEFGVDLGMFDEVLKTPCPRHDPLLWFIRKQFDERQLKRQKRGIQLGQEKEVGEGSESNKGNKDKKDKEGKKTKDITETNEKRGNGEREETKESGDKKPGPGPYNIYFERSSTPHGDISVELSSAGNTLWQPLLAKRSDEPQTPGYGRILDPNWIDLNLAKQWKKDCLTQHGEKCHNSLGIRPVPPAWLIDTVNDCLVPGTGISDYVALSYRWGTSTAFCTLRHLLASLLKPGSLSPNQYGREVPPGIKHAMKLVGVIDERYLWVDAMCIVQDDETHREEQLQLMGTFYSSAKLTIVAADGDAAEGILGLRGISPPRKFDQVVIPVFETESVIIREQPLMIAPDSPYFERGWTFQEFLLSKRRLIFTKKQIHWHCTCADWTEDIIATAASPNEMGVLDSCLSNMLNSPTEFGWLNLLLRNYNDRKFTYAEDALPGISGLLAILSRSFDGGFLFGLPEMCFDSALLWYTPLKGMKRRKDSGRTKQLAFTSRLPSWSWIGWWGFSTVMIREETFAMNSCHRRTIPITQWYTHKTPQAAEKRPIQSSWLHLREKIKDSNFKLPKEWTREIYDEARRYCPPEGLGNYIYSHATFPNRYFWLPVPILAANEDAKPFNPPQTPYISCETKRGWFSAMRIAKGEFMDDYIELSGPGLHVKVVDSKGKRCGQLSLHTAEDLLQFPAADSGNVFKVELVAICRQRIGILPSAKRNGVEFSLLAERPVYTNVYRVLWVHWIDSVAYRKASGIIMHDAWEGHDLEDVHLVMG